MLKQNIDFYLHATGHPALPPDVSDSLYSLFTPEELGHTIMTYPRKCPGPGGLMARFYSIKLLRRL